MFFFSDFHADALVRDTEGSNVYFSTPSPTTSSPSPGFLGLEEVHIKGELRRIQSALPDLVVPENPIKHHHSWLHSPLLFFLFSFFKARWLFRLSLPLSPAHKRPSRTVRWVGQNHLLTRTHGVCFAAVSCLVLSVFGDRRRPDVMHVRQQ